MDIKPEFANLKTDDGVKVVSPNDVKIDDILVVNPGEKIPVDGIITNGQSSLDMKSLNGEAMPKDVNIGDLVLSGSINLSKVIEIKVTKEYLDSTVAKILDLVENSTSKKSKNEKFITEARMYYKMDES